jgi:hypothetical protein
MSFNQSGWTVQGDVYNTAGNLINNPRATRDDLAATLVQVKQELARLEGLPAAERLELEAEVDAARDGALDDGVPAQQVAGRLEQIRARLQELDGVAAGAVALAKTIGQIGAWVGAAL